MIDPATPPARSQPESPKDLVIAARRNHVLAFDNLSEIAPKFSDALCGLSTGSGFGTRILYTDEEENLFYGVNPVILNGIGDLATAADLLSRTFLVELPAMDRSLRVTEEELRERFERLRPMILGAALDVVVAGLKRLPEVVITDLPRMADAAKFVTACEPALGWTDGSFLRLLKDNEASKSSATVDAEPVATAVIAFAADMQTKTHEEGATVFLRTLTERAHETTINRKEWPKQPNTLTKALNRLAKTLRTSHDIDVRSRRTKYGSVVTITKLGDGAGDDGVPQGDAGNPHPHVKGDDVTMVTVSDDQHPTSFPPTFSEIEGTPVLRASSEAAQQVTAQAPSPSSPPSSSPDPTPAEAPLPVEEESATSADCIICDFGELPQDGFHGSEPCPRFPHNATDSTTPPSSGNVTGDAPDTDTSAGAER